MSRAAKRAAGAGWLVVLSLAGCSGSGGGSGAGSAAGATGGKTGPATGGKPQPARVARKAPVEVEVVTPRTVSYGIETVGEIQADEVVRIPARVSGVLEAVRFREGMAVVRGTVLARIDAERYQLAVTRAQAAARQSEAQMKEAQAALEKRKALRGRDPGWVSEEELSNFGARVEESQAAWAAARAALALAEKDLRDSAVRADAPGIINQKLVDTGQYVTAGTPIATLIDNRRLKLSFKVSESESVRLGQVREVRFRVRSLPGREFSATIYHVGDAADPGTRMVPVLAWVGKPRDPGSDGGAAPAASSAPENAHGELKPGYFADVTIEVESREALVVPTLATLPSAQGFITWVLTSEETAEPRKVELGLTTRDGHVEVTDGLAAGDRVVVRGGAALKPGMTLQILPTTTTSGGAR